MKIVNRSYRYRFYPTDGQKEQLARSFGCSRFVYNFFLKVRTDAYCERGENVNYHKTSVLLTSLKKHEDFKWLKEVSSVILQQTLRDLDRAFTNFFSGRSGYPVFKNKNSTQSVRYVKSAFCFSKKNLLLAKIPSPINIRWSREFSSDPSSLTILKDRCGRYFVSFEVSESVITLPFVNKEIGVDVGVRDICVTSDGYKSGSHKFLKKYEKLLLKRQRELSKKKLGSRNREKARLKLAKVYAKISDCRNDFNNKLTTQLVNENQVIAMESLCIKEMVKKRSFAKCIMGASWGDFFTKLKYKSSWYGRQLLEINRWFPSSKRCSSCGHINNKLKLNEREWRCPSCKVMLDRDVNAAKNILTVGQAGLAFGESGRLSSKNLE